MIGELLAMKFVGKRSWMESLKYGVLAMIGGYILSFGAGMVTSAMNLSGILSTLVWVAVALAAPYLVLKYIIKYPDKKIKSLVLIGYGINVMISIVVTIVLLAIVGAAVASFIGVLVGSGASSVAALI